MPSFLKKFLENIDLVIVALLASVIRVLESLKTELWFDEAFTGVLMKLPFNEFLKTVSIEPHPPLFYAVTKTITLIFGVSDLSLRALPILFGVLSVVFVYLIVQRLFDRKAAAFSALIVAISPFLVEYSVEARPYSMYGFLFLLTFYFFLKKNAVGFVLSSVLFLSSHYLAFIYFSILGLYGIYELRNSIKKLFIMFVPGTLVGGYFTYNAYFNSTKSLNSSWISESSFFNIISSFYTYFIGVKAKMPGNDILNNVNIFGINETVVAPILVILFVLGLAALIFKYRSEKENLINFSMLISFFVIPQIILILVGIFTKYDIYVERYLFPSGIMFGLFLGVLLYKLFSFELSALALLAYVFVIMNIIPQNYHQGLKEMQKAYSSSPYQIVMTSPIDYLPARYYFGENFTNKLKLYNPANPDETFFHWQFVPENSKEIDFNSASFVITEDSKITENMNFAGEYGNYKIYILKPNL